MQSIYFVPIFDFQKIKIKIPKIHPFFVFVLAFNELTNFHSPKKK